MPPAPTATPGGTTDLFAASDNPLYTEPNILIGFNSFLPAATNVTVAGEESGLFQQTLQRVTFDIDSVQFANSSNDTSTSSFSVRPDLPPLGTGTAWIGKDNHVLQKVQYHINLGVMGNLMMEALGSVFNGTPTPGGATPTPISGRTVDVTITISNQNDPSITIPTP